MPIPRFLASTKRTSRIASTALPEGAELGHGGLGGSSELERGRGWCATARALRKRGSAADGDGYEDCGRRARGGIPRRSAGRGHYGCHAGEKEEDSHEDNWNERRRSGDAVADCRCADRGLLEGARRVEGLRNDGCAHAILPWCCAGVTEVWSDRDPRQAMLP